VIRTTCNAHHQRNPKAELVHRNAMGLVSDRLTTQQENLSLIIRILRSFESDNQRCVILPIRTRRTTRHPGYAISLRIRKRIEEVFGWSKSSAGQSKTRFRGLSRVRFAFTLTVAAYNLVRLPKLLAAG